MSLGQGRSRFLHLHLVIGVLLLSCLLQRSGRTEPDAVKRWTAARIEAGSPADWQRAVDAVSREQRAIADGLLRVVGKNGTSPAKVIHAAKYFSKIDSRRAIDWCYENILKPRVPPLGRVRPSDVDGADLPVVEILVARGVGVLPGAIRFLEKRQLTDEELSAVAKVMSSVASSDAARAYVCWQLEQGERGRYLPVNAPMVLKAMAE